MVLLPLLSHPFLHRHRRCSCYCYNSAHSYELEEVTCSGVEPAVRGVDVGKERRRGEHDLQMAPSFAVHFEDKAFNNSLHQTLPSPRCLSRIIERVHYPAAAPRRMIQARAQSALEKFASIHGVPSERWPRCPLALDITAISFALRRRRGDLLHNIEAFRLYFRALAIARSPWRPKVQSKIIRGPALGPCKHAALRVGLAVGEFAQLVRMCQVWNPKPPFSHVMWYRYSIPSKVARMTFALWQSSAGHIQKNAFVLHDKYGTESRDSSLRPK